MRESAGNFETWTKTQELHLGVYYDLQSTYENGKMVNPTTARSVTRKVLFELENSLPAFNFRWRLKFCTGPRRSPSGCVVAADENSWDVGQEDTTNTQRDALKPIDGHWCHFLNNYYLRRENPSFAILRLKVGLGIQIAVSRQIVASLNWWLYQFGFVNITHRKIELASSWCYHTDFEPAMAD